MHLSEVTQSSTLDFSGIESSYFLLGLLSAFDNRFQAMADRLIGEISWKQFFTIICIQLCKESPTLQQLADVMGTSHQNCKQLLLKLEKKGFVGHKAFGTTYQYYPLVKKKDYTQGFMKTVLNNFFGGSIQQMLCFFSDSKSLSISELEEVIQIIKDKK